MIPMAPNLRSLHPWMLATLSLILPGPRGFALEYAPPPGSKWINVRTDLGLRGDGVTDDTAALLAYSPESPHHAGTLYFPNGTYLFRDTLYLGNKRLVLQGESRDGVVLRLMDGAPGFGDPEKPKPFVSYNLAFMDQSGNMGQAFKNSMFNMTLEVGAGNPGAVALHYLNNNQGTVANVRIRSLDPEGAGRAGLGLVGNWPGPALITGLEVEGFDYGIWSTIGQYGITFEHIRLRGQRLAGIRNRGQALFIRGLVSDNTVPALINTDPTTNVVLVDSELRGGAPGANAVENWQLEPNPRWTFGAMTPGLFVRNVRVEGYGRGLVSRGGGEEQVANGPMIEEFVSRPPQTLGHAASRSLDLPWEDAPRVDPGDPSDWVNILDFADSAVGKDAERDWSPAIQAAIDDGAEVIWFPMDNYPVRGGVEIRGRVRAFMGMDSTISTQNWPDPELPLFRFGKDAAEVVLFDRINDNYGRAPVRFEHAKASTLIIRNALIGGYRNTVPGGRVFLYDVCGSRWDFDRQDVWARQLNAESSPKRDPESFNVRVRGGRFAVLGIKTEYGNTVLEARDGAKVEVLGGWSYHTGKVGYLNDRSDMSLAGILTSNGWFTEALVREMGKDGATRSLRPEIGKDQQNVDGSFRKYGTLVPLYLGHGDVHGE